MKCLIPVHVFLLTNILVLVSTLPLFKCHNYTIMGQNISIIFVLYSLFSLLAFNGVISFLSVAHTE